jgi:hypothetical protein
MPVTSAFATLIRRYPAGANWTLHAAHLLVIGFAVSGWMLPVTRDAHLVLVSLIALSWFGLGAMKGIGYCPVTDLHWKVRSILGLPTPDTYIKLVADSVFGTNFDSKVVSTVVWVVFLAVAAIASVVNFL